MKKDFLYIKASGLNLLFVCSVYVLLILMQPSSVHAASHTVNRPQYIWNSQPALEVEYISTTDTATTVHFIYTGQPGSHISIAATARLTDDFGNSYKLKEAAGIVPGKKTRLPEKGALRFSMAFNPVVEAAHSVTFTETGTPGKRGITIAGIALDGTLQPLQLPNGVAELHPDTAALPPSPTLKYGTATIRLHLLDYRPEMDGIRITYAQRGIFQPNVSIPQPIYPDSAGCMTVTLPVAATTPVLFIIQPMFNHVMCYAEADRTTNVYLSLRELSRRNSKWHGSDAKYGPVAYFTGPNALLSQEMTDFEPQRWSGWDEKGIENWDAEHYAATLDSIYESNVRHWNTAPVSKATRKLGCTMEGLIQLIELQHAASVLSSMKASRGIITEEYSCGPYRDSLEAFFMTRIARHPALKLLNIKESQLCADYASLIGLFPDSVAVKVYGTDKGPYFAALKATDIFGTVCNKHMPLDENLHKAAADLPTAYREMIEAENDALLKEMQRKALKTDSMTREVPQVADRELLQAIVNRYRGKVVVVNFWGTWCGNCIWNHKIMKSVSKKMAGKDVVFVYIADGKSSPVKTWKYIASDVDGEHYKLTDSQWRNVLKDVVGTISVPRLIFFDRNGHQRGVEGGSGSEDFWLDKINSILAE